MDMVRAYNDISLVKKQITENRNKVEQFHQHVYNVAMTLAAKVGVLECMPRTFQGRQSHRANPDSNSPQIFIDLPSLFLSWITSIHNLKRDLMAG